MGKPAKRQGRKAIGSKAFSDVMIAWLPKVVQEPALSNRGWALALFLRLLVEHLDVGIPAFAPHLGERGIPMHIILFHPMQRWS